MKRLVYIFFVYPVIFSYGQETKLILPIGHAEGVRVAIFSPDGKKVATSSPDNTVKIWNTETGRLIGNIRGQIAYSRLRPFSPDGKFIVSSEDSIAYIWNSTTCLSTKKLVHRGYVNSVSYSPNGKQIVTASNDGTAKVWDSEGNLRLHLKGNTHWVTRAEFSDDNEKIITVAANRIVAIWNSSNGKLISATDGHSGYVSSVSFSPDSKEFVTASYDSTAIVWSTETAVSKVEIRHNSAVNSANFSPDGKLIVTATNDNGAQVWSAKTGEFIYKLPNYYTHVYNAGFSHDGSKITTVSFDGTARIWDAKTGRLLVTLPHDGIVYSADFSPDDKRIVTASNDNTAKIWTTETGIPKFELKGHTDFLNAISLSPDGETMVVVPYEKTPQIWNRRTGRLIATLKGVSEYISAVSFSPNGKLVATAVDDSTVRIWNTVSGEEIFYYKNEDGYIVALKFSNDGENLGIATDQAIRIIDTKSQKITTNLKGSKFLSFSPNGEKIVTGSQDNRIILWNSKTAEVVNTLSDRSTSFLSATFSQDGKTILTTSSDSTVSLWDCESGYMINRFTTSDRIYFAEFLKAGKEVIVGSEDGTVKIWNLNTKALVKSIDSAGILMAVDTLTGQMISVNYSEAKVSSFLTGNEVYRFIILDDEHYFGRLPSGYYYATPHAAKLLHFVTDDQQVIHFGQLDVRYNRPDLVLKAHGNTDTSLLNGYRNAYLKRVKKLGIDTTWLSSAFGLPLTDIINREDLSYEQISKNIQLRIKANDSSYRLDRLNLWINESPLFGYRGVSLRNKQTNNIDTTIAVVLSAGRNIIEASAININGTESYRVSLEMNYTPIVNQQEKLHFIGIGINKFKEPGQDLSWSVKDIRDLTKSLKEKYGNDISIDTLFDENVNVTNVLALKEKLKKSSIDDKVIIAYSGHGLLSNDFDYYLSTYNVSFSNPEKNGLPYDALEGLLDGIPARKKLILIDACHSGEVDKEEMEKYVLIEKTLEDSGTKSGRKPVQTDGKLGMKNSFELMQELFVNVSRGTGATVISAAAGTQFAMERGSLENGVFTYSILEYMKKNPSATVSQLKEYVNKRVSELTNGLQVPTARSETRAVDWRVW